jgi:hypothetical protein
MFVDLISYCVIAHMKRGGSLSLFVFAGIYLFCFRAVVCWRGDTEREVPRARTEIPAMNPLRVSLLVWDAEVAPVSRVM